MPARTVCLDFDGIFNVYTGWGGEDSLYTPRPGIGDFLKRVCEAGYRVVVLSTRRPDRVYDWLVANGLDGFVDAVTREKPPAFVYGDDRAVCFHGDFDQFFDEIVAFKPFWGPEYPTAAASGVMPPYAPPLAPADVAAASPPEHSFPEDPSRVAVEGEKPCVDSEKHPQTP